MRYPEQTFVILPLKEEKMRKTILYLSFFMLIIFGAKATTGDKISLLITKAKEFYEKGDKDAALNALENAIVEIKNTRKLTIKNLHLCKKIMGYQLIEKRDGNMLNSGDPLLVYFEPENFMVKSKNGKYEVWLSEDARLLDEKGKVLFEKKDWVSIHQEFDTPIFPLFFQDRITGIPPGKYRLEITLNDKLKGSFVTRVVEFSVK